MIKKFLQFINERVETSSHRLHDLMNYFEQDIDKKIEMLPDFFKKYIHDDVFNDWVADNWIYDEDEDPENQFAPEDIVVLAREYPDEYKKYCEYLYSILHKKNWSKQPLFMTFTFEDDVHDKWMVHFTDQTKTVDLILNEGFEGVSNIEDLAYIPANEERYSDGYCFAFEFDDSYYNFEHEELGGAYGNNGVIFKANGVKLWHDGDRQLQTIFIGNEAKDLYGFYYKDGKYVSANGKLGSKFIGNIEAKDFEDFKEAFENIIK